MRRNSKFQHVYKMIPDSRCTFPTKKKETDVIIRVVKMQNKELSSSIITRKKSQELESFKKYFSRYTHIYLRQVEFFKSLLAHTRLS